MIYLRLFHGRKSTTEHMDDWGTEGPTIGPFRYIHTTYGGNLKYETADGENGMFEDVAGMIHYAGVFYGDWVICADDYADAPDVEPLNPDLIPVKYRLWDCDCEHQYIWQSPIVTQCPHCRVHEDDAPDSRPAEICPENMGDVEALTGED